MINDKKSIFDYSVLDTLTLKDTLSLKALFDFLKSPSYIIAQNIIPPLLQRDSETVNYKPPP